MNKIKNFVLGILLSGLLGSCVFAQSTALPVSSDAPKKIELKAPIAIDTQVPSTDSESTAAENPDNAAIPVTGSQMTDEQKAITDAKQIVVKDINYDVNANSELTKNVVPNTSSELEKLVLMFAQVMLAVIVCTIIIYLLLLFVRKFFHPNNIIKNDESYDIRDLNSPNNTDDAIKSFLDKTKE